MPHGQPPMTASGQSALAVLTAAPDRSLVAFDYDGTLAPIVDDPERAVPQPGILAALEELSRHVGRLVVLTGRPVPQLLDLAGLTSWRGGPLAVVGHYGLQRWEAATGQLSSAEPAPGLEVVRAELPALLSGLGLESATVEDKGLSVAVHVRRLTDPDAALAALAEPMQALARRVGLVAQPGRRVIEIRPVGIDKGDSLRRLVDEQRPAVVAFAGDDVGDLPAFTAVEELRGTGLPGLLVCSGSAEVTELADRADIVVDGPSGVTRFVTDLAARLGGGSC